MSEKLRSVSEIVGELAGHASMCWSETPKGVFDSEQASKAVDKAVKEIGGQKMSNETTLITKKEYANLLCRDMELSRLEAGGVDNWDYYGDALNPDGELSFEDEQTAITKKVNEL